MNIKYKVRTALLEFEEKPHLNSVDQKVVDFIVGEGITEAGNDIISRFMSVVNSNQRKFITAAVMTALMATPSFSHAMKTAAPEDKATISQFMSSDNTGKPESSTKADFTLNFSNSFASGQYEVNQNDVANKLQSLKEFLSKNPNAKYKIKITASESQVPNQNNMKMGQLAQLRSEALGKIVSSFLGSNNIKAEVEKETKVGKVAWDGQNKDDQKYTNDQYVKLEVFAEDAGMTPCDISFSKNDGTQSSAKHGYVSFEETVAQGGSMTITPGSIPDRLVVTQGDKVLGDTGYFVDKQHNYEQWNLVPLYVAQLTQIYKDSPDLPAIRGVETKSFGTFEELMMSLMKAKYDVGKDTRTEIKGGVDLLKQLWDAGQREFVMYSTKKGTVNFKLDGGEGKIVVYSPVGKTGFGIEGNCK